MSATIELILSPPYNEQFYTFRDIISGTVIITLEKPLSVQKVDVIFMGTSETVVRPGDYGENGTLTNIQTPPGEVRSDHVLVNSKQQLFPPENVANAIQGSTKPFKLERGKYEYTFSFQIPKKPKCISTHPKKLFTFLSDKEFITLPPSFNNSVDRRNISNLDTYFYTLGQIEYRVYAKLFTGKGKDSWFNPFKNKKIVSKAIEFIPSLMPNGEREELLPETAPPLKTFSSKFNILLNDSLEARAEVRARTLNSVFRLDYLFKTHCGKFDEVYLVFSDRPPPNIDLRLVRVQLNLLEMVTYLATGRTNANINSLRLAQQYMDLPIILSHCRRKPDGSYEYPIHLDRVENLNLLQFNQEDYRHKGNRLYSFTTCNIKRKYKFQLFLDWNLNGKKMLQTEILTNYVNVFCESLKLLEHPPQYSDDELPPQYDS